MTDDQIRRYVALLKADEKRRAFEAAHARWLALDRMSIIAGEWAYSLIGRRGLYRAGQP
jgi:hypothetical protein